MRKITKKSVKASIAFIEMMIQKVEKSDESTFFMDCYRTCVLGSMIFNKEHWVNEQRATAAKILGLKEENLNPNDYFFCDGGIYNEAEWTAIKLFTPEIIEEDWENSGEFDFEISKEDWLVIAKQTIEELKSYL